MSDSQVVIVGAGPAGLSAAVTAATIGLQVTIVDERPSAGGRLRYDPPGRRSLDDYLSELSRHGVRIRSDTVAWGIFPGWRIALETSDGPDTIGAAHVMLATGSTDRALAFEGNTLPGVMSGLALRRLIREFSVLPGQRTVILGDEADAVATADTVRAAGGEVVMLIPEREARAIIVEGLGGVERVIVGGEPHPADLVAVAVGRQPDVQLATMAELELVWVGDLGGWVPLHHLNGDGGQTGLYVIGDAAGIDDVEICEVEGEFAALLLGNRLGLVEDDRVATSRADLIERRPDRMAPYDNDPRYEQPWRVPIEVDR